jgi:DNA polymerase-2
MADPSTRSSLDAFVLTRQWRDGRDGVELTYWLASERGPVRVRQNKREAVMFVPRGVEAQCDRRKQVKLTSLQGDDVDALYFASRRKMLGERDRLRGESLTFESDLRPSERFLMERFITGPCRLTGEPRRRDGFIEWIDPAMAPTSYRPRLKVMSFDIETDGIDGAVLSIAALTGDHAHVMMQGKGSAAEHSASEHSAPEYTAFFDDERSVIEAFYRHVAEQDPDVLVGWNVVDFDLAYLQRRSKALGLELRLGRGGERAAVLLPENDAQLAIARIPGRAVIDGIGALKSATHMFESFTLEHVSRELLGRGKAITDPGHDRMHEIRRMFHEDKAALAHYNLEDCRLVAQIFERADLLEFSIERQRMTGLAMGRVGGSVAAFDHLYLPRLHRAGFVAHDVGSQLPGESSPGGYVLASDPGLYRNVLVLDFKSLYPSIIRTFKIDPLGMAQPGDDPIAGFDGGRFARERHILPELIERLWTERDRAKRDANKPLSQAIKILMNSFYGVLGTPGCRFSSASLTSSITRRGHQIITESRDWIVERGWRVIYGDTDSLFVLIGEEHDAAACEALGHELTRELNHWWRTRLRNEHRIDSHLEVEFETHYRRFFMPTLRGSTKGSAKRYAGLVREADGEAQVIIKGLEAVRTDWTPMARAFQRELLRRAFLDEPWKDYVRETRDRLMAGELDDHLVYKKRLRRALDEYASSSPPHVKAARMLGRPVREVRYVITVEGPQPLSMQRAALDYHHYVERQLAPAADTLLACFGTDFNALAGTQLSLF